MSVTSTSDDLELRSRHMVSPRKHRFGDVERSLVGPRGQLGRAWRRRRRRRRRRQTRPQVFTCRCRLPAPADTCTCPIPVPADTCTCMPWYRTVRTGTCAILPNTGTFKSKLKLQLNLDVKSVNLLPCYLVTLLLPFCYPSVTLLPCYLLLPFCYFNGSNG